MRKPGSDFGRRNRRPQAGATAANDGQIGLDYMHRSALIRGAPSAGTCTRKMRRIPPTSKARLLRRSAAP